MVENNNNSNDNQNNYYEELNYPLKYPPFDIIHFDIKEIKRNQSEHYIFAIILNSNYILLNINIILNSINIISLISI